MFLGQALVNTTSNNTATQRHGQVGRPSVEKQVGTSFDDMNLKKIIYLHWNKVHTCSILCMTEV